jgi:hypothetical protein
MSYNYTLRYRTFDQVLEDIHVDFQNYNLENMIEPQQLIKVVKRCNYDLGLRIYKTKEAVLEISKGRVKLPDDFYVLNYAMVCDEITYYNPTPQGTWIEDKPLITPYKEVPAHIDLCTPPTVNCTKCTPNPCVCNSCTVESPCDEAVYNPLEPYGNTCNKPRVYMNCRNECYEVVQIVKSGEMRTYKRIMPLRIINNAQSIDCECPNLYVNSPRIAWIKDGYLYTNLDSATVYVNYQGTLEDEDGNLLLPDHDMINEYYEYALKKRILENLIMNDENVSQAKIQLIEQGYRASRNYALTIVNTPNFAEMRQVHTLNRKAQYARYYDMFKSYGHTQVNPIQGTFINNRI